MISVFLIYNKSEAAFVNGDSSGAWSIKELEITNSVYNFVDFTYTLPAQQFDIRANSEYAATAVIDALNFYNYDIVKADKDSSTGTNEFYIQYGTAGNSGQLKFTKSYVDGSSEWVYTHLNTVPGEEFMYAVFSVQEPSAVPIPASAWLLGAGVIGLLGIKRKFTFN